MRKSILIVVAVLSFISCEKKQSQEEIIRENISTYIKKDMNDPESFEFVDMEPLDTVTKEVFYDREIGLIKITTDGKDDMLKRLERNLKTSQELASYGDEYNKYVDDSQRALDEKKLEYLHLEKQIDSLNKLKETVSEKDIEFFTTTVRVRGNNSFGAKILTSYLVRLDPGLNVTYVKQRD